MLLRYGGDVHIDDDENWSVNSTRGVRYMQRGKRLKKIQKMQKTQKDANDAKDAKGAKDANYNREYICFAR